MSLTIRIIFALLASLVTAAAGAFIFWSAGVTWTPGPALGQSVFHTVFFSVLVFVGTLMALNEGAKL